MINAYSHKSDAQLRFIIKDAAEAATCMRDHDAVAEAKYLDQVNDATTELAKRLTLAGMAKTVERLKAETDAARNELFETLKMRNPHPRGTEFTRGQDRYQVSGVQPSVRKLAHESTDKAPDTGVWLTFHYWTTAKQWSRSTRTIWISIKDPT